jgi:predicted nucleic acid-binding protein
MGAVVCLDTMILIWGVKRESGPSQELKIKNAVAFLKDLEEQGAQIIIPAPVLAEVLTRVPEERFEEISGFISTHFMVMPFDAAAAVVAARLRQTVAGNGVMKQLTDAGVSKREIKLDIQIAAVAIAQHASCIYSNDGEMSKVACGMIEVKDMPHAHVPELFPPIEVDAPAAPREAAHRIDRSEGAKT